jgi:hypothetical protein
MTEEPNEANDADSRDLMVRMEPIEQGAKSRALELLNAATLLRTAFETAPLVTAEDSTALADVVQKLDRMRKNVEVVRKKWTEPLFNAKAAIDEDFRPIREMLERLIKTGKDRIALFAKEQRRLAELRAEEERKKRDADLAAAQALQREAEEKAADAAAETMTADSPDAQAEAGKKLEAANAEAQAAGVLAVQAAMTPVTDPAAARVTSLTGGGMRGTRTWKFRVVNPALIPREFLVVDEPAIRAALSNAKKNGLLRVDDAGNVEQRFAIPGVEIYLDESVALGRTN